MLPGVRPSISFASLPTARTFLTPLPARCTATTDGSLETMPLPLTKVSVVAVPRSMARSFENSPYTQSNNMHAPHLSQPRVTLIRIARVSLHCELPRTIDAFKNFVARKLAYAAVVTTPRSHNARCRRFRSTRAAAILRRARRSLYAKWSDEDARRRSSVASRSRPHSRPRPRTQDRSRASRPRRRDCRRRRRPTIVRRRRASSRGARAASAM